MSNLPGHKRSISGISSVNQVPISFNRIIKTNTVGKNPEIVKKSSLTPNKIDNSTNYTKFNKPNNGTTLRSTTPILNKNIELNQSTSVLQRPTISKLSSITNRTDRKSLLNSLSKLPATSLKIVSQTLVKKNASVYNLGISSKNAVSTSFLVNTNHSKNNKSDVSTDKIIDNSFSTNDGKIKVRRNSKSPSHINNNKDEDIKAKLTKVNDRISMSKSPAPINLKNSLTKSINTGALTNISKKILVSNIPKIKNESNLLKQYEELKQKNISPINVIGSSRDNSSNITRKKSEDFNNKNNNRLSSNTFKPRGTITIESAPNIKLNQIINQSNNNSLVITKERENKFILNNTSKDFKDMNTSPFLRVKYIF